MSLLRRTTRDGRAAACCGCTRSRCWPWCSLSRQFSEQPGMRSRRRAASPRPTGCGKMVTRCC
ncbi:MAG: hypothetical protein D6727_02075 [Gammaproteobacteria bacterium]|nr:MAG: hypothetical protein D6727_02075 [Gammaproteobacteria bacterium]